MSTGLATADCAPDRVDIRGDFGSARFSVELAMTAQDQAQGLMFRESLPRMGGMLFVYAQARNVSFWMRNTVIPLDMLFIDDRGRVLRVHHNAIPLDETPISAGGPTIAVLEINGGLAETLGIEAGAEVRTPVLPQENVVWACD